MTNFTHFVIPAKAGIHSEWIPAFAGMTKFCVSRHQRTPSPFEKGIEALMKYIFDHTYLQGIFRWFLMTEDAHGLYQNMGLRRRRIIRMS